MELIFAVKREFFLFLSLVFLRVSRGTCACVCVHYFIDYGKTGLCSGCYLVLRNVFVTVTLLIGMVFTSPWRACL